MQKTFLWFAKALVSGVLALTILTAFCVLYYNLPVHSSTMDGATDYSWQKNKFYSRGTEGFAWGKTNNEGYLNPYDYQDGMNIDVLLMGSSHMEAFNVAMEDSTASQLDLLLESETVYNIGVSAHTFLTCCNNFEDALKKYNPQKYVVIETATLSFGEKELEKAIQGTYEELPSHSGGIIGLLQKNQFLRLLYSQLTNWKDASNQPPNTNQPTQSENDYEALYLGLLTKLSQMANSYGVKLIILHHPRVTIDTKNDVAIIKDTESIQRFATYCEMSGVEFLDMSNRFLAEYNENHILPHGFANTSVGKGHLNKHGHRMIAEELFKIMEGEK